MSIIRFAAMAGCLLGSVSCTRRDFHASQTQGHFEASTPEESQRWIGKQRAIPESAPSRAVLISASLLTSYERWDLVDAILAGGAEVWLATAHGQSDPNTIPGLRERLGERAAKVRLFPSIDPGHDTGPEVWMRDFAPVFARADDGKLRLLDFNYHTNRPRGDALPRTLAEALGLERVSVPLYLEPGNFMIDDDGLCVVSQRVIQENGPSRSETAWHQSDIVYTPEQVVEVFKQYAGCTRVEVFGQMPFEPTGHIDLWAKFTGRKNADGKKTVLVGDVFLNEFRETHAHNPVYLENVLFKPLKERFLDAAAQRFRELGYEPIRVPIGSPEYDNSAKRYRMRSYLNSVFVNDLAIVPHYSWWTVENFTFPDKDKYEIYRSEAAKRYEEAGFRHWFVESSLLAHRGGAVHCVTMQVPR